MCSLHSCESVSRKNRPCAQCTPFPVDLASRGTRGSCSHCAAVAPVSLIVLFACEDVPASIDVTPDSVILHNAGSSLVMEAEVLDDNGEEMVGFPVTWTIDSTSVATVDASGRVVSVELGRALVTGSAGSVSDTSVVLVRGRVYRSGLSKVN